MTLGMEVGLDPVHIVLDEDTALLPKRGGAEPPIFGPSLLWPNGWMRQDATWYGCRPQPRRLCVTWGPSPYPQRPNPIFGLCLLRPNGCMDQDATWYGGRPRARPTRYCVRCGSSYPQKKGGTSPHPIWPMSIVAMVAHLSYC